MTEEMADFSHWPESFDGYTHFWVERLVHKNGQNGKFRRGLKKIVEHSKPVTIRVTGASFPWLQADHGGQIQLVTANKGWADMADEDPSFYDLMSKELGGAEEFDKFMADWGSTFKSGQNWTVERMPEASDYGKYSTELHYHATTPASAGVFLAGRCWPWSGPLVSA